MTGAQKGYAMLLAGILFLVSFYILLDYGFQHYPSVNPESALFFGGTAALLCVVPVWLLRKSHRDAARQTISKHARLLLITGLLSTVSVTLWQWAMLLMRPDMVVLIGNSEIIFAFLLGVLVLGEKTSVRELAALVVAIVGIWLVASVRLEAEWLPVIYVLVASLFLALQSFLVKRHTDNIDGLAFSVLRTVLIVSLVGAFGLITEKLVPLSLPELVIFGTAQAIGFIGWRIFYFNAHNYLPISKLNPALMLVPVLVLLVSWAALGIPVTFEKMLGAVLIIGGLFFFSREQLRLKST